MADERESYYRAFGWRPPISDPRDIIADSDAIPILAEVDPAAQAISERFTVRWADRCRRQTPLPRRFSGWNKSRKGTLA
jgi:hypothetical protein